MSLFTQPTNLHASPDRSIIIKSEHNGTDGGERKSFQESEDKTECVRHHL